MRRRGFTLLEMALVVSILAVIAALGLGATRAWTYEERKTSAELEWARAAEVAFGWLLRDLRESRLPLPEQPDNGIAFRKSGSKETVVWRAYGGRLLRDEMRVAAGVAEMDLIWDGALATVELTFEAPTGEPPHRRTFVRTVEVRSGAAP